jgi:hypothetical protein
MKLIIRNPLSKTPNNQIKCAREKRGAGAQKMRAAYLGR